MITVEVFYLMLQCIFSIIYAKYSERVVLFFFLTKMKIYLIGKVHLLLKHDKFNLIFFRWLKFLFISELLEFIKKNIDIFLSVRIS